MCSTVVIKVAAIAQLPVSSICTCVYFTQYSAEMHRLRTYVKMDDKGVSRLDRIRNADQKGRLNQEASLNYVRYGSITGSKGWRT